MWRIKLTYEGTKLTNSDGTPHESADADRKSQPNDRLVREVEMPYEGLVAFQSMMAQIEAGFAKASEANAIRKDPSTAEFFADLQRLAQQLAKA